MNEYYISRETESEEDIEHYGVVGMKWGHRNRQDSLRTYYEKNRKVLQKILGLPSLIRVLLISINANMKKRYQRIIRNELRGGKIDKPNIRTKRMRHLLNLRLLRNL